jgi:hypothetical protein
MCFLKEFSVSRRFEWRDDQACARRVVAAAVARELLDRANPTGSRKPAEETAQNLVAG